MIEGRSGPADRFFVARPKFWPRAKTPGAPDRRASGGPFRVTAARKNADNGVLLEEVSTFDAAYRQVQARGWSCLATTEELIQLARRLGRPACSRRGGQLLDSLRPRERVEAPSPSLSAIHGLSALPLHSDGAHWPVPPRFIVMRAEGSSACATNILDTREVAWSDAESDLLHRGVLLVRDGRRGFATTILSRRTSWLRFDEGCMSAGNGVGRQALALAREKLAEARVRIAWLRPTTLIIDNWRCLHGREAAQAIEGRVLQRVLVI